MKATRLKAYGGTDQFVYEDAPDPVPAGDEDVLIRVAASSLNPVDLYVRQGFLANYVRLALPAVLGEDLAGTIVSVGSAVAGLKPGDRVAAQLPIRNDGAHAELVIVPAPSVAKVPDGLGFAEAAAIPLGATTGFQAVARDLYPLEGKRYLVSGPLGATGRAAIFALKHEGVTPIAAIRPGQEAAAAQLGIETFVLGTTPAEKFDGAVDTKGGETILAVLKLVRDGGKVAAIAGAPDGTPTDGPVKIVNVSGAASGGDLQLLLNAAGRGELKIPVAHQLPLAEVGRGHDIYAAGGVTGKTVFVH